MIDHDHLDLVRLYFAEQVKVAESIEIDPIAQTICAAIETFKRGGCIFLAANGGPAGTASGAATDLLLHPFVSADKSSASSVKRLKVIPLIDSSSTLTAISNDMGFESSLSQQLEPWVHDLEFAKKSLLWLWSGSGNSKNMLAAAKLANDSGMTTACISGRGGGQLASECTISVVIPGSSRFPGQTGPNDNNFHIEDAQGSIAHIVVGALWKHVRETTP